MHTRDHNGKHTYIYNIHTHTQTYPHTHIFIYIYTYIYKGKLDIQNENLLKTLNQNMKYLMMRMVLKCIRNIKMIRFQRKEAFYDKLSSLLYL